MSVCESSFNEGFLRELKETAYKNRFPLSVTFELTPLCNFSCVMCYVHLTNEQMEKQGRMLSAEEWIKLAAQAKEMGTLYITLTGGEPFTRPDFWQIYSQLSKMGFLISILSNGYLIDESVMEKFREYGTPYMIKLSAYGASNEAYQKTCKVKDGFTKLDRAVTFIKEAGIPFAVTATVVKENMSDLKGMIEWSKRRNVPFTHSVTVVKSARGAVNTAETSRFSFDEFIDGMSLENIRKNMFPPLETPFAWCSNYRTSAWVTWKGNVQQCSFMNAPYATLENGFESAWNELGLKLDALKSPPECTDCEYSAFCQRCPGILCGESGNAEKIDTALCNTAKRLYEAYTRLTQEEKL